MAKKQGDIRFGVQFQVDKSGLNELKTSLQNLTAMSDKELIKINPKAATEDLNEIRKSVEQVQKALEDSFNPKLDTTDLTKFRKSLNDLNISKLKADFDKFGESGKNAFRNLTVEILTTKRHLKESSQWLDKMAETLSNTVRWTIASSAVNAITGSVQKAFNYTQKLDKSLNDIVIVTGKGSDEMEKFARKANDAAKALGAATTDYTKASLIYYQQGLSDREVQARANVTTKVSNVTGQSADTTSEQLTAIWNGYKVSAQEAELYIDKVSAVAATTAADLEELATGMSKVASAANIMGVDIDQLNAQLATIVSVTREAPESIGTALKTVYARMSDIEAGLDTETTLGEYTKQMEALGIKALDARGNLRDMGDVVEEIGGKWSSFNRNQQVALAQIIAGTRQYSRMMALFDNWDMYESAKNTSENSIGALQQQNERYMDSMEAHLNQLTATAEGLYDTLLDPESLNPLIDVLTGVVGLIDQMIQGLGGGGQMLINFGAIGLNVFGDQITKGISKTIRNIQGFRENLQQAASEAMILQQYGIANIDDERTKELVDIAKERLNIADKLSEEERDASDALIIQTNELYKQQDILEERQKKAEEIARNYTGQKLDFGNLEEVKKNITASAADFTSLDGSFGSSVSRVLKTKKEVELSSKRMKNAESGAESAYEAGDVERFDKKWQEYDEQLARRTKATEALAVAEDEERESLKAMVEALLDAADTSNTASAASKANAEELEELQAIVKAVTVAFDEEGNVRAENAQQIEEAEAAIKRYNKLMEAMKKRGKDVADGLEDLDEKLKKNKRQIDENKEALKGLKDSFKLTDTISNMADMASGIANIGASIQTLHNLGSIWDNDDLTTGEKLLQTITNVGFALGMLASSMKTMSGLSLANIKKTIAHIAALREKAKADKEAAAASKEHAAAETAEGVATEGSTKAAKKSKTSGKNVSTSSKIGFGIAAALAAFVISSKLIDSAANQEEQAAEAANKATQAAQENIQAVKENINELNNAVTLLSSEEVFKGLTKGSFEWNQALLENNEKVLALTKKYKDLETKINTTTGALELTEESLIKVQNQELAQVYRAQGASIIVDQQAKNSNIANLKDEYAESINNSAIKNTAGITAGTVAGGIGGAIVGSITAGAVAGTAAGTAVPGLGNLVGLIVGVAVGAVAGIVSGVATNAAVQAQEERIKEEASADFDKLAEAYIVQGEGLFSSNENLIDALGANVEALTDSQKALLANTSEVKDLIREMAEFKRAQLKQDSQYYTNALQSQGYNIQDASAIAGIIASNINTDVKNNQIEAQKKQVGKLKKDKSTILEWAYAMGLDISESDISEITGSGFKYKDENGEIQSVDSQVMVEQLAAWKVAQSYLGSTGEIQDQLLKLYNGLEKESINTLQSIFATNNTLQAKNIAFTKELYQDLQNKLEDVQAISQIAGDALVETIKGLESYYLDNQGAQFIADQGWSENVHAALKNAFLENEEWKDIFNEFSSSMIETFGDAFQKIESIGGETALNSITAVLENVGVKNAGKIMSSIDWLNSTSLAADFASQLDLIGYNLNAASQEGFEIIYALSRMNGQMALTREGLAEVATILSQLSNESKQLSKTEYESLIQTYGSAISQYFALMADGTYRLTTSAAEFYNVVQRDQKQIAERNMSAALDLYANTVGHGITIGQLNKQEKADVQASTIGVGWGTGNTYLRNTLMGIAANKKVANEAQAIDIVKMFLDSGTAEANNLREAIKTEWGDLTQVNWSNIVDATGGTHVGIDLNSNWFTSAFSPHKEIGYDTMINAILAKADADAKNNAPDYHVAEDLKKKASEMLTKGLINTDQYNQYVQSLLQQGYLQIDASGQSDAQRQLQQWLDDTAAGSETAKQQALDAISMRIGLASSQEEANSIIEQFKESDLYKNLTKEEQLAQIEKLEKTYQEAVEIAVDKRYETENKLVNQNIDLLEEQLGLLEAIGSSLSGQAYLNNLTLQANKLKEQVDLLEKRKELYEEKLNTEQTNEDSDFNKDVSGLGALLGLGSNSGNILTYIGQKAGIDANNIQTTDDYNKFILAIEEIMEEELQGESEDVKDAAKTYLDSIKENIGGIFSVITSTNTEIQNKNSEAYKKLLEHFKASLDQKLDLTSMKREFNQFVNDMFTDADDYFGQGSLLAQDFETLRTDLSSIEQAYEDLQSNTEINAEDKRTLSLELQQQYQEKMLELKESLNQLEETQIAQMDEIAQGYADQVSYLEEINSLYDHQISLAELVGKKNGETLEQYNTRIEGYYKAQENNLNIMRAKYQNEYEYWQGYLATLDPASDAYENARNKMLEAGKNAAALGVEYGQMVADNFKRTVENSVNELFEGLEWAKQELDWLRADAERYYNQVDAYFEINKLEAQIRKDMNSNASLNAQRKMNEFLEEQVASLREIDKLSEADLKRAQAKYDLLQAQIALEEAQANKTQMRLVRGADGSYSYEYVADTGAIAEKEQEVLEAQQAIMDLDKEEVRNHFDEVYDIAQEFIDKYVAAFEDMTIDAKESALLGDIWNSLVEKLGGTSGIIAKLKESTQAAASALGITDLTNITDAQMAELFPELNSDMYGLIQGWVNDPNAFNEAAFNNLMSTTDADQAKAILSALGLATDANLGELNSTYSSMMGETALAMVDNKTALADLTTTVNTARDAYDNMASSLRSVIREMTIANMIASGSTANEAADYVDQYFPIAGYATGGYTGEWGPEGKFLLAHEKELILNKTDTANILDAVNIIRDLQFSLDASVAGRLADMIKSYESSMHAWSQTGDQVIEQNIEINAEFPNATDSEEIEKAFEELLNMAAQRIAQR